ncbi:hypothetical protein PybrP1_007777 [[Pythium] brassicae (nom. inval.)]|nr:hypothetical protein PybrP1_007777 [[Pythium] brassicae (nom. inval.)]
MADALAGRTVKLVSMDGPSFELDAAVASLSKLVATLLILAANYLDIKSLLDLACAKVAIMIKGKTPDEIRSTFDITAEFTPEEEQMIREENKWDVDL